MVLLSTVVTYAVILMYTRLAGLRSFSKMSASDFAMTVAVGSLFASTISSASPTLGVGVVALASLFAGQWLVATSRRKFKWASQLVDNQPLLLMTRTEVIDANLRKANVTRSDLYSKLRESNVLNNDQVVAVVFETTGNISVLHSDDPDPVLDIEIFKNVIDHDRLLRPPDRQRRESCHL